MSRQKPRKIDPGTALYQDVVRVISTHEGIRHVKEGKIGTVTYSGTFRQYFTAEGGLLYTWTLGRDNPEVYLIEAAPVEQEALPGL